MDDDAKERRAKYVRMAEAHEASAQHHAKLKSQGTTLVGSEKVEDIIDRETKAALRMRRMIAEIDGLKN